MAEEVGNFYTDNEYRELKSKVSSTVDSIVFAAIGYGILVGFFLTVLPDPEAPLSLYWTCVELGAIGVGAIVGYKFLSYKNSQLYELLAAIYGWAGKTLRYKPF